MSGKAVTTDVIDTGGQFFTRVNGIGCQFAVCVKTPAVQLYTVVNIFAPLKNVIALRALGEYDS
jgi:hypothetical protein